MLEDSAGLSVNDARKRTGQRSPDRRASQLLTLSIVDVNSQYRVGLTSAAAIFLFTLRRRKVLLEILGWYMF